MRGLDLSQIIGTVACLAFAVVWMVAWFNPPDALSAMFFSEMHRTTGKYIPPAFAALLFAGAPVMRRDTVGLRIICSAGIVLMISPGLWDVAQGGTLLKDATVWLSVPLGIAAWVLSGSDRPRDASEPAPAFWDRPGPPMKPGLSLVSGIGIVTLVLGCLVPAGQIILNFGFGDIVVPRYAAITFGLCCITAAFVARKLRSG